MSENYKLYLPGLHTGAELVLSEARRENWANCGRRWRKTSSIATHVVIKRLATVKNEEWLWGAPTYDQVQVARAEAERAANGTFKIYKADRIMECPWTRSLVRFRSLDNPDNARGHTAHGIVIDEAADINPEAWHKVLRPMMLDTNGIFWGIGTPKGHNWFWRECQAAMQRLARNPNADTMFWSIPTLGAQIVNGQLVRRPHPYENPNISFEKLLEWFNDGTTPEQAFRQEYLAEFLADGAGVFLGVEAAAFGALLAPPYFGPFCPVYGGTFGIGVDWGRYNDFTVVTVMDAATKRVVDWYRLNNRSFDSLADAVATLYRRWHVGTNAVGLLVEFNSIGMPQLEKLWAKGIPATPWLATNTTKAQIVESLQFGIEHRAVQYPQIPILKDELHAFTSKRLPSGLIRYTAPDGGHDDTVISLALAYEACQYRQPSDENPEFTMELDATEEDTTSDDLMAEYKASLVAASAKQSGHDRIPFGAQQLLQRYGMTQE